MSDTNKLGWDFTRPDGEQLVWMDNVDLPDIYCGICGYNFKRNKYPYRIDCPSCEAHKMTSLKNITQKKVTKKYCLEKTEDIISMLSILKDAIVKKQFYEFGARIRDIIKELESSLSGQ